MADLTIRNLTATPLELKLVERFDGKPTSGGEHKIKGKISGVFKGSSVAQHARIKGESRDRQELSIPIGRFETRSTDVQAPEPGREVVRLTFEYDGHKYQVDVPGESRRSLVMKKLDNGPHEYTVVYVTNGACVSIYSSTHLSSWMKELRDEWPLPALSIPGTHNSPTCHVALPSVRCQAASIREQLDNGVRFFDVRVQVNSDDKKSDLILVHSAFPISLTGNKYFHDLLADVYSFLDANPSETLIMSIKREGTGKGTDQQLSKHLHQRYAPPDSSKWWTDPRIPRLGEARGRIVLFRRHANDDSLNAEHGGRGYGLDCSSWPDNCEDAPTGGPGLARVQDFYEMDQSHNISKKIDLARAHLERAAERVCPSNPPPGDEHKPFFVNFLSASNFFNANCWPEKIAAKVNPAIIEYMALRHGEAGKGPHELPVGDGSAGLVVTDWVGLDGDWDLIRCIVGWNARLQLKE
ncbi:phosphatidylinositol phospholipase c [Apiospora arundinis]|uniref:Phosphatidylinositol-specific phospholipase C n=1 Tax=Apiospora arundinis TaxID=335852 RepID=A0ABR2J8Q5_9PEZI